MVNGVLVYFCDEKSISNLVRYGILHELLKSNQLILTTLEIAEKFSYIPNLIAYKSNWTKNEESLFADYLYLQNLMQRKNKPLNIVLRTRIFGPYKIRSLKKAIIFSQNFYNTLIRINWILVLKSRNLTPDQLLIRLREKRFLSAGDFEIISEILTANNVKSVSCFTTLRSPLLFDFVSACNNQNIETNLFPDSWDNFSSNPYIPNQITNLFVWSKQQELEIDLLHPYFKGNVEVYGSYRISKSMDNFKSDVQKNYFANRNRLKLLYLEGYIFEDFHFNLQKIIEALINLSKVRKNISEVDIVFRNYPMSKQHEKKKVFDFNHKLVIKGITFSFTQSKLPFVVDDLAGIDFVITDCTTAALEAAFSGLDIVFIGSKQSPRYIDTIKVYKFSFSKDLNRFFPVVNLSKYFSTRRLSKVFQVFLEKIEITEENLNHKDTIYLKYRYFAEPLKVEKMQKIFTL